MIKKAMRILEPSLCIVVAALGTIVGASARVLAQLSLGESGESAALGATVNVVAIAGVVTSVGIIALLVLFPVARHLKKLEESVTQKSEVVDQPRDKKISTVVPSIHWMRFAVYGGTAVVSMVLGWHVAGPGMPYVLGETESGREHVRWLSQALLHFAFVFVAAVPLYIALRLAAGSVRDLVYTVISGTIDVRYPGERHKARREALQVLLSRMKPLLKAIGWVTKTAFLIGVIYATVNTLTGGIQILVGTVQNERLREQNELIRFQNIISQATAQTTIIDQQFQQESDTAEQAYIQIRDILLRATAETTPSSYEEQVFALQAIPDAMRLRVTRAVEVNDGSGNIAVERRVFLPNLTKLRPILRDFLTKDRIGYELTKRLQSRRTTNRDSHFEDSPLIDFRARVLTAEETEALASLRPVSKAIFETLHEVGSGTVFDFHDNASSRNHPRELDAVARHLGVDPLSAPPAGGPGSTPSLLQRLLSDSRFPPSLWNLDVAELGIRIVPPEVARQRKPSDPVPSLCEAEFRLIVGLPIRERDLHMKTPTDDEFAGLDRTVRTGLNLSHLPPSIFSGLQAPIAALQEHVYFPVGAILRGAHLECTDLSSAYLVSADLSSVHLQGADLGLASLQGATLRSTHLEGADLFGTHLEGADLSYAHLEGAALSSALLEGAGLFGTHLEGADLSYAHLEGAKLSYAHLEGANLSYARMGCSTLEKTHLEGADLRFAELQGAQIEKAVFHGSANATFSVHTVQKVGNDKRRLIFTRLFDAFALDSLLVNCPLPGALFATSSSGTQSSATPVAYVTDIDGRNAMQRFNGWRQSQEFDEGEIADNAPLRAIERKVAVLEPLKKKVAKSIPWFFPEENYPNHLLPYFEIQTLPEMRQTYIEYLNLIFGDTHVKADEKSFKLKQVLLLSPPGSTKWSKDHDALLLDKATVAAFARANQAHPEDFDTLEDLLTLPPEQLDEASRLQLINPRLTDIWRLVEWLEWSNAGGVHGAVERALANKETTTSAPATPSLNQPTK